MGKQVLRSQPRQAEVEELLVDRRVPADPDQRLGQGQVRGPLDEQPAQAVGLVAAVGRRAAHAQALRQVVLRAPEGVVVHLEHEVLGQAQDLGVVEPAGLAVGLVERQQQLVDPVGRAGVAVALDVDRLVHEPDQLQGLAEGLGRLRGDLARRSATSRAAPAARPASLAALRPRAARNSP